LELSVIIGWPITGGGRGQGPPVDQSGAGGRKATSVPYPQTPVGYAHGRMTNENQYRMNTIILFYRQHALHAMQAPIY